MVEDMSPICGRKMEGSIRSTRFVQEVSGLELQWLFTGRDVFATSLGMFVRVLATRDIIANGCVCSVGCYSSRK
jgi:hypothetical protein